ncbi:MAG: Lrp/AsnC family transcriptional regulator [Tistrella sp.]|uniref:AsnC family transcriptional regulator n=1 Tax=Tistrella mobilis TaxID=171437 RepID=A0A162LNG3_9PROT|nr:MULTISPECIES: Lrp/AsnC family transcriptional regulator [Tistrella]KYO55944.1 AsnC family transcriptional regulator [Tistrella mobilis]MAD38172.1 Lrp/AsnC family transcriptional regulator [Tistrella sp.]MAM76768.1 Lrp/AsnC family transcriptional regulator [Tistrella sp.]MBA77130.1 Lrp/AsnC family transcriptional regulator [Tistrella sp.]HAE48668.1 Lrp/AsnC family transcriptional regulator [Tistrella mobilis]|tara:strand:- start:293 stop:772 length:480 start_codon:yes stop_codon:yes gene_type:complete
MPEISFDAADIRIMRTLQGDGRMSNQDLAQAVGLSPSPCWRRVRRLEELGVIRGYGVQLDRRRLGLGVQAFVRARIGVHSEAEARLFEAEVMRLDEVTACWAITGEADFLLQVVAADLDAFGSFAMTVVRRLPGIREMHSSLVLREIKAPGTLPLPRAG